MAQPRVPHREPQHPPPWTKQEALVSFKNPKKDVVVYLEADTCVKCFEPETPVLTRLGQRQDGRHVPIENGEVFLKKIRIKGADLGTADYVDLKLAMNRSFVPKTLGMNADDRELGLIVYHLYVGEADKLGSIPGDEIVDAGPLAPAKPASKVPAKVPAPVKAPTSSKASPAPSAKKG